VTIQVNGVPSTVRRILWLFLQLLRASPVNTGKFLFVNAICINQTNVAKRSA
jgi:hypothetical protein